MYEVTHCYIKALSFSKLSIKMGFILLKHPVVGSFVLFLIIMFVEFNVTVFVIPLKLQYSSNFAQNAYWREYTVLQLL